MDQIRKFYEQYREDVLRYLLHLTGSYELAEELLSETFLAVIASLTRFRGESDPKTWLFSIARNKWVDHLRRENRTFPAEEFWLTDLVPGPEERLMDKAALARVWELLEKEDQRARTTVQMRLRGYSYYEIASHLQIREGSARVLDFRTRRKLLDQMIKEGFYEQI